MKGNKALRLIAVLLCAAMLAVFYVGCSNSGNNDNTDTDPTENNEVMVTESPDGSVTASPTREPDASGDPAATGSASSTDPAATEPEGGADATPNATEPGASDQPGTTGTAPSPGTITTIGPEPTESDLPILTTGPFPVTTPAPGNTSSPTANPTQAASTPAPSATPLPNNSYEAHYAGAVIEQFGLKAGDSFYWTLDLVNEHSRLWSGQWLVDYPENYLTADSYSVSWSGGITAQVQATWDDETDTSDIPAIVCNPDYMGNTGGHPLGQAGNMYANIGMYLTSFHHYGVQASGSLIRFKFVVKAVPPDSALKHDSNGYYIEIPVLVCESTATEDAPAGYPVQPFYGVPHGHVTVDNGKIYIKK